VVRVILTACLAATLAVAAGCGSDDDPSTVTETVTSSSSTEATSTTTDATSGDGTTPAADQEVTKLTGFTSPTGNIGCYIDRRSVRCDISKRDWDPPARPAGCAEQVDYGQGITMKAGGAPEFVCAGDTALGGGDPLAYGQSIAAGLLRCESEESGMTCTDTE
jgi:hypothetical protein